MNRLIAVSNRMPPENGGAGSGGLSVVLDAVLRQRGGLWLGWSGRVCKAPSSAPRISESDGVCRAALDLSCEEHAGFYLGFSNSVLWPLCHGAVNAPVHDATHYATYLAVNQRFAAALLPLLRPEDHIWVHDYHLLPLGQKLREAGSVQSTGFFLHVPFPELSALQGLPSAPGLMQALLAYDALGFQTAGDLAAFHRAAQWQWGSAVLQADGSLSAEGRRVTVGVFPVGVQVDDIQREVHAAQQSPAVAAAGVLRRGGSLLISADRLMGSKGLRERLLAYEAYLALPSANRQRPCLLQIAAPSRLDPQAGAQFGASLQALAARISERHACADWTPLRYLNRCFPHEVLMGLLHAARVGIVTPLRDGMNLVAKEFVAAQDPADPGVLVLSVFAGAAHELAGAIQVDPRDTRATASAISQACDMTLLERRERHQEMIGVLRQHDLRAWHTGFLRRLRSGQDCGRQPY